MRWLLRWLWRSVIALAVLAAALFAYGYVATWQQISVKPTVSNAPALPTVTVRGIKLHLRELGSPSHPTVIVLHGGPGADFRYLLPLEPLADRYHLIFYDQRGSGLSQRVSDEELTLHALTSELDGIVDRYGKGRKVRLIGHSWGAMLASGYLGKFPDKVSHAVLAEPGMLDVAAAKRLMSATNNMRPRLGFGALVALAEAWFSSLHVKGPDDDASGDYFFGRLVTAPFEGHPTAGYFCGDDPRRGHMPFWRYGKRISSVLLAAAQLDKPTPKLDFVSGVERFHGEVLFIAGSCNRLLGPLHQRRQMRYFPRAKLEVIAGAGHTMFGEKPKESLAIIRGFFGEGPTSAPAGMSSTPPPTKQSPQQ